MSRRLLLERTTMIAAPIEDVFEFFSDPANLGRITPPEMRFRITSGPERRLQEGDRIEYSMRVFGVPIRWRTHIVLWREREAFADLQERGPYKYWLHMHAFRSVPGGVEMHDRVEYELPFGLLGRIFGAPIVVRQVEAIFDYRSRVIRGIFPG